MIPLVDQMVAAGVILPPGQCYGFKTPPVLGGDYTVENVGPLPVWDYLGAYGSIHEQLRDVADGSQVVLNVVNKQAEPAAAELYRSAIEDDRRMARTEIHVAADIRCFGVEVRAADDAERRLVMTPPAELGLSDNLVSDFRSWQWWFDGVVDLCGLDQRFEYLGDKFDEVGQQLAQRVAAELGPSVRVIYRPQGGWCRRLGHGQSLVVQD